MRIIRILPILILWMAVIPLFAETGPTVNFATLDITRPLGELPAVTPQSDPTAIAHAIQGRLDFLATRRLSGRVFLPAGEWAIDSPIFLTHDRLELVGAGVGETILRAVQGHRGMPMVNLSVHEYMTERPWQACNRLRLTDPAARVLDASVTGEHYGLRTYTEYPATTFPQVSHISVAAPKSPPNWQDGTAYKENDVVLLHPENSLRGIDAVCVQTHTAGADNKPYAGAHWKDYWVLRLPFNMQFVGSPLSAGPYNPQLKRAANWGDVEQFTFDLAITFNAPPSLYREESRPLCGTVTTNGEAVSGHTWLLSLQPGGRLAWDVTLADGTARRFMAPVSLTTAGTYRLAVQMDFPARTTDIWLRKPDDTAFTRVVHDTALPAGTHFAPLEYGYFSVAGGESGNPGDGNGNYEPPTDITICGLHDSAALRYDDATVLLRRDTHMPADDNYCYFANDRGAIAYLPLTDNPPDSDMRNLGRLITVQHGEAAGDAKQQGYGFLQVPAQVSGIEMQRVSDMTIAPGSPWGAGILCWHTLDPKLWNLDIRGGYYAIGDLFYGAQYTLDIRDALLSGSEAAFNGSSNIAYMRNVTINPVGRCGMLVSGSNMVLDGMRFVDPQTHQSEYYFRHIATALYGGMNALSHVRAEAPANSRFPSKAAFSMTTFWQFRTSMILDDCAVANMGPNAAFLNLDFQAVDGHGVVSLDNCRYTGSRIATFIRADSPLWSGSVQGFDIASPVKRWVELLPSRYSQWKEGAAYQPNSLVAFNGQTYRCLAAHKADKANQPGAAGGGKCWHLCQAQFVFSQPK